MFEKTKTQRGFTLIKFDDLYTQSCSLQKSSLATEDAIWLGVTEKRMHLSREQVKELLPYLIQFTETGDL